MNRAFRLLCLALAGCGGSTSPGPDLTLDDLPTTVTLAAGEERRIGAVLIRFLEVKSDSRCPRDVQCVHAGNAEAVFRLGPSAGDGPAQQLVLNTSQDPRAGVGLGLSVTLVKLAPDPVSTTPTRDYRAEVTIGRSP